MRLIGLTTAAASNRWLESDTSDRTFRCTGQNFQEVWNELYEIVDAICLRDQQYYGNVEFRQMLLKGEIPINGNERIEFSCSKGEQLAVGDSAPAALRYHSHMQCAEMRREPAIDTFVE